MDLEHEKRLTDVEARSKSNTRRIDELSGQIDAVNRLATAVEVLATKQDTMGESVDRLESKVDCLEEKPAKRWEAIVDKSAWAVLAAVIAFLLGRIGL